MPTSSAQEAYTYPAENREFHAFPSVLYIDWQAEGSELFLSPEEVTVRKNASRIAKFEFTYVISGSSWLGVTRELLETLDPNAGYQGPSPPDRLPLQEIH